MSTSYSFTVQVTDPQLAELLQEIGISTISLDSVGFINTYKNNLHCCTSLEIKTPLAKELGYYGIRLYDHRKKFKGTKMSVFALSKDLDGPECSVNSNVPIRQIIVDYISQNPDCGFTIEDFA